jgi:hypothetical protein
MSGAAVRERLREVESGEWDELLAGLGCEDAYLSRAYVETACLLDPGRAVFLHVGDAGGDVALPCILREVPGEPGLRDVTAPYPYGGPIVAGDEPPVSLFHALYEDWCREQHAVTTFVRFHPLLENHVHAPAGARLERLADSASWPLGMADLFAGMHRSHRNKCRKARAAGVEVRVERGPGDLDGFLGLHADTMRRSGAAPFYRFSGAYWSSLVGGLGERVVRLDARLDGELVGSELCLAGGQWLHYHMGVTSHAGRSLGVANLLVYEAASWAKERGFTVFHLGSGLGGTEDSLWAFKNRFSPGSGRAFWIGKLVHDPDAYRTLTGSAEAGEGFFPAYRSPPR